MNRSKLFKAVFFILCIQFGGNAIQGMAPVNAPVEIYFLPKNFDQFNQRLMGLLDNAKDHVFVAVYWLTDTDIINKLIELKKRGIDVKIIFDQSMNPANVNNLVRKLLQNNIVPYVLPSKPYAKGSMHNKFVVIDRRITLTGSANFTYTASGKDRDRFNNENVVIFNSIEVAAKYEEEFLNIQDAIANLYVNIIADKERGQIPNWIWEISTILYAQNLWVRRLFERNFSRYGQDQQHRLAQFFDLSMSQFKPVVVAPEFSSQEEPWDESDVILAPVESVPAIQRPVVVAPEFSLEEEPWSESDVVISEINPRPAIIDAELDILESPANPLTQHQIDEPLTYAQKYFLESRNIDVFGMSKDQASQIIGNIKRAESRPYYK